MGKRLLAMIKEIKITEKATLTQVVYRFGTRVETVEGNRYYEVPFWFKPTADGWVLYGKELPEDLQQFICKAGLGGDNPKPKKVEL